jgi:predicted membrane channel-forming protein YqfA (hemolysin III family)
MIPDTRIDNTPEPTGEGMLFLIAFAVFAVVIVEAAFIAIGGTALMVATVLLALLVTGGVVYMVGRTIGPEEHDHE